MMDGKDYLTLINNNNIKVAIRSENHFTLGTSPYHAHQHGLAIDIYKDLSLENNDVLSPVSGTVINTKTLKAPRAKFEGGIDQEYLAIIDNPNNSHSVYKILHVKPALKIGEKIEIGDFLGTTIRNGYFAYWSSPHVHLEIRPHDNAIRASGGNKFPLYFEEVKNSKQISKQNDNEEIPIEIYSSYDEFILARLPREFYHRIGQIYGIKAKINGKNFILDGGIPHYKNGILISRNFNEENCDKSIYLGPHYLGDLTHLREQFGFFKFAPLKFLLNNEEIRGCSLYLAGFLPFLKIIPYKKNQFNFKTHSIQSLVISTK